VNVERQFRHGTFPPWGWPRAALTDYCRRVGVFSDRDVIFFEKSFGAVWFRHLVRANPHALHSVHRSGHTGPRPQTRSPGLALLLGPRQRAVSRRDLPRTLGVFPYADSVHEYPHALRGHTAHARTVTGASLAARACTPAAACQPPITHCQHALDVPIRALANRGENHAALPDARGQLRARFGDPKQREHGAKLR
jgi:hypothetical protein